VHLEDEHLYALVDVRDTGDEYGLIAITVNQLLPTLTCVVDIVGAPFL
jgi:hypothetical protein